MYVFVALVTQYAMRVRRIILSSVACPASPYFSLLSHIRHDFRGGGGYIEHKLCVLTQRGVTMNVYRSSCEVLPAILIRF